MSAGNERGRQMNRVYARGLTVHKSPIDGKGCFATIFIPRGRWVAEYEGELVSREEGVRRMRRQRKKRVSAIDSMWSIDGGVGGNGTEYINHSCEPSCSTLIISGRIKILALRDIFPGEEITVGYMDIFDFAFRECRCRSERCGGKWDKKSGKKLRIQ
jgi:SET domain-containing protein